MITTEMREQHKTCQYCQLKDTFRICKQARDDAITETEAEVWLANMNTVQAQIDELEPCELWRIMLAEDSDGD